MSVKFINAYLPCCSDCQYLLHECVDDIDNAAICANNNVVNEEFVGSITMGCQSRHVCHVYLTEVKNCDKN